MKKITGFVFLLFIFISSTAQKNIADSLSQLLSVEKSDTGKVKLMWQIGSAMSSYNPEDALTISQKAVFLAKKINYEEGLSRSLGVLANTFTNIGNYPRSLEYNLEKLKLEEKRKNHRNLASVLMNIGIVYALEEEYQKALPYYRKSDSVITNFGVNELRYYIKVNLGDVYDKLNINDSAFYYYDQSLRYAKAENNDDFIGASMTGLGHYYRKSSNYNSSLFSYHTAIHFLKKANDDFLLCEATLGLAKLFQQFQQNDSAAFYAKKSFVISKNGSFLTNQLDAADFLKILYQNQKKIDSAFFYYASAQVLNDSVNSKARTREIQVLSTNEQIRQLQIEEEKKIAERERSQQLQLLFIALFIPGFFLLTLLMSKAKTPVRVVRVLGILSLLILFEYLTLLLHPTVQKLTHHTPVLEIIIFVIIAAFLIPAHHRIEHWLIKKLVQNREKLSRVQKIKLKTTKIKLTAQKGS
ncbi:MAG: hypothetical protein QM725_08850 [Lacibacter sp.]